MLKDKHKTLSSPNKDKVNFNKNQRSTLSTPMPTTSMFDMADVQLILLNLHYNDSLKNYQPIALSNDISLSI